MSTLTNKQLKSTKVFATPINGKKVTAYDIAMSADDSTPNPGGATTQVQYNNAGTLAGATGLTTDGSTITVTGNVIAGSLISNAGASIADASRFGWNSRSKIGSPADGTITLYNALANNFTNLQLGGTTASFPALKVSTTTLEIRLADDSAFTAVQSLYQRFGAGTPEGAVTAPIGAIYHRTNGGANTTLYVKESGAGNTGWVAK